MPSYTRLLAAHGVVQPALGVVTSLATFGLVRVASHRGLSEPWVWDASPASYDYTGIVFVLDGRLELTTVDVAGDIALLQGDAALIHSRRSAALRWADSTSIVTLWVPTDAIIDSGLALETLPSYLPRTALLNATLAFISAAGGDDLGATRFTTYVVERLLTEMAFAVALEGRETARVGVRDSLVQRARTIILVRRAEPALTASSIAQDLHVSLRNLQRAFSQAGLSPTIELRRARVDLAQSILRDHRYTTFTIAQVAVLSGFTNAGAMRRAFTAEDLPTPRGLRSGA